VEHKPTPLKERKKMTDEVKKDETTEEAPVEETKEETAETPEKKAEEPKVEEKKEEPKEEPKAEAKKEEKPVLSGKFKDLIKEIETMSVSDLAELVKALEDRFGVSAAMPMAVAGAPAGGAGAAEVEEKSSYNVMLKDGGAQKIAVIKAVREINQDLGLVDAKNLVDSAPKEVKKDLPKDEAEEAKKKLEAAGATVELV
jgi:large subunit ribosomal protein L7/L12